MRSPKLVVVALVAASAPLLLTAVPASAGSTLLVDDDGQQCGPDAYSTITAALERAVDGDVIRVCPGRYDGGIHVARSVSILGPLLDATGDACVAEPLARLDDTDPTQVAVIQPQVATTEASTPLMTLAADGVEVAGLVFQGVTDVTPAQLDGYDIFTPALLAQGEFSGQRVHHNLIRKNTLGIELGNSGASPARVDHNCLRENRWGLANQRQVLNEARIEANSSYRSAVLGYEVGWGLAGTSNVTVQDNYSLLDATTLMVEKSTQTRIIDNTVTTPTLRGFRIMGGNDDLQIRGNAVTVVGATGFTMFPPSARVSARSTQVVIQSNRVTGNGSDVGFGIAIAGRAATGVLIADNVLTGNGSGGINILDGNSENLVRDNDIRHNAGFGIRIQGTSSIGNTFRDNVIMRNGTDARDDTDPVASDGIRLLSTWVDNKCKTDVPAGVIC